MKIQLIKFSLALCLLFNFNYVSAEEVLTLLNAVESAKLVDPAFASFRINQQVQGLEVNKAFSAFLPQVRITTSQGRANTNREVIQSNQSDQFSYDTKSSAFQVRQTIYNQSIIDEFQKSKVVAEKGQIDFFVASNDLVMRVSLACLNYMNLFDQSKIATKKLISLEEQVAIAKERYAKGFGTITEISESEMALKSENVRSMNLTSNLNQAKIALESLIGRSFGQFTTPDPLNFKFKLTWIDTKTLDYWLDKAMTSNRELQSLGLAYDILEYEKNKARSAHIPSLDLIASKTKSESENNFTIGSKFDTEAVILQLNVPVFQGGFVSASVDQIQGRVEIAQQRIFEKQNELKRKISDFHQQIASGLLLIELDKTAIESSELALEGTEQGFLSGFRSNIELLNAKVKAFQAKEQYLMDFYKLLANHIQLKSLSESFSDEDVKLISEYLQSPTNH